MGNARPTYIVGPYCENGRIRDGPERSIHLSVICGRDETAPRWTSLWAVAAATPTSLELVGAVQRASSVTRLAAEPVVPWIMKVPR